MTQGALCILIPQLLKIWNHQTSFLKINKYPIRKWWFAGVDTVYATIPWLPSIKASRELWSCTIPAFHPSKYHVTLFMYLIVYFVCMYVCVCVWVCVCVEVGACKKVSVYIRAGPPDPIPGPGWYESLKRHNINNRTWLVWKFSRSS
jgi:hypothetical protein